MAANLPPGLLAVSGSGAGAPPSPVAQSQSPGGAGTVVNQPSMPSADSGGTGAIYAGPQAANTSGPVTMVEAGTAPIPFWRMSPATGAAPTPVTPSGYYGRAGQMGTPSGGFTFAVQAPALAPPQPAANYAFQQTVTPAAYTPPVVTSIGGPSVGYGTPTPQSGVYAVGNAHVPAPAQLGGVYSTVNATLPAIPPLVGGGTGPAGSGTIVRDSEVSTDAKVALESADTVADQEEVGQESDPEVEETGTDEAPIMRSGGALIGEPPAGMTAETVVLPPRGDADFIISETVTSWVPDMRTVESHPADAAENGTEVAVRAETASEGRLPVVASLVELDQVVAENVTVSLDETLENGASEAFVGVMRGYENRTFPFVATPAQKRALARQALYQLLRDGRAEVLAATCGVGKGPSRPPEAEVVAAEIEPLRDKVPGLDLD
ncbi:hypothetical protein BBJ28_00024776, partial [Nothophytophthora sp. Chile5]